MRGKTKLIVALALATLGSIGVISTTTTALPAGIPSDGVVTMTPTTGVATTSITLLPPSGAACQGDSVSFPGYRWQGFIATASIDPGTLTYNGGAGPVAPPGKAFPLVQTTGTPVIDQTTGVATTPGGPGLLTPFNNIDFSPANFPPGTIADGTYNIGYACTQNNATTRFWAAKVSITNPGGVLTYSFGGVPNAPALASPLTAGDGTLAGTFTESAAVPSITGYTVIAVPTSGTTVTLPVAAAATSFALNGLVNGTSYAVSLTATNAKGAGPASNTVNGTPVAAVTTPPPPASPVEVALVPGRLADTRLDGHTVDTLFAGQGIRPAGSTLELTVANRGGVDPTATAVVLNVTAADAVGSGFVTVYPCGVTQPTASNLNYGPGDIVPNAVMAKIGSNGQVCIFVSQATDIIVDVNGFFPANTSLQSINPARVLETRPGLKTVDGLQQGGGPSAGGSSTAVQIGGRATVPSDAAAVVLNVTVTGTQAAGFITVYPCGTAIPTASNINYVAGDTVANLVVAKIGAAGTVCLFTNSAVDLIADVNGYFPAGTSYQPLDPARLLETRTGLSTIDGQFNAGGLRTVNTITPLTVTGRGGVPDGATTAILNVTVTETAAAGFVTVYPCGVEPPLASNLNYGINTTVANAVIVKIGAAGQVCLLNSGPTQLVVDVNGYMTT
jgi:hypothetical protein